MSTSPDESSCDLTLFVSGASDRSVRAIRLARELCDVHLRGRARLSIVDVHEHPGPGGDSVVLATPTLVKNAPLPVRRVVGDLSNVGKVLRALGLCPAVARDSGTG